MIVHFKSQEHRFLSNFYYVDIRYDGVVYPSVEHAYMSAKSNEDFTYEGNTKNWKSWCAMRVIKAAEIKKMSREVTLIPDWNKVKFQVMFDCLTYKFSKEPLRSMLLATGEQNIQEGNWHGDRIWGVDLTVTPNIGENFLGRMLMKVRKDLQRKIYDVVN